jgi:hypothetical protein
MRFRGAFILTLVTALSVSGALAATAVKLPAAVAGPAGTDFTVKVQVDTGGTDLTGADLQFTYDDTKLELLGVYKTAFSDPLTLAWSNTANGGADELRVQLSGSLSSPSGDHEVAWAVFRVLAAPASSLTWDQAESLVNGAAPDSFFDGSVAADGSGVGFRMSDTANGAPSPSPTSTRSVDIVVAPPAGLLSFDITVEFDPNVIDATGVTNVGTATAGWELTSNTATDGRVLISLFSSSALAGTDPVTIAKVQFSVTGEVGDATPLAITRYITNDLVTTYRDDGKFTISADADADGWTVADGDCNDLVAAINPAAQEICDVGGVDEDCDGWADDADPSATGQTPWYADADTDTYGNAAVSQSKCDQPSGYVADATDCNDGDGLIYPGATERCNGIDDSCDTIVPLVEIDNDTDTYVECSPWSGAGGLYGGDCNDAVAAINPGVAEICGNTIDDDCDTFIDNVLGTRYVATTGANGTNECVDSGTPCLTIQHAVNVACPTETVQVAAGTFVENLRVPKALTVNGAGAASTTVLPANSLPNPCSGSSMCGSPTAATNLFLVESSNVTLSNLTLDGDNPAFTSGIVRDGADLDARNGIIENIYAGTAFHNTTIHNVTVKNIYLRGIYVSSGGSGFNVHHNTVQNVQGDGGSIALFGWSASGTFADNVIDKANDGVSANHSRGINFLRNTVTSSGSGVHTDNAGDGGGTADLLEDNDVSACADYGYGVWVFTPYIAPTVRNNTITHCDVGLGMFGGNFSATPVNTVFQNNVVDGDGGGTGFGTVCFQILTTTWYWAPSNTRATLTDNTFQDCLYGLNVGEDSARVPPGVPDYTKSATLEGTGNVITSNGVGVLVDADVDSGLVDLSGNKIYGNTTSGFDNAGVLAIPYVLAECTWWGSDAGPVAPNNGTTGSVDTSPWAANSTLTPLDYYVDGDSDGYGDALGTAVSQCGPPFPGRVTNNTDCNDGFANINPGAYEYCDTVDNNCDLALDGLQADADCDDSNSCNVERCSGLGACYFDSFSCTLAGNLYYYRDSTDADGVEDSSTKGVPGVAMVLTGHASGSTTTANPDGAYTFTAGGNEILTPQDMLGMFEKPDDPGTPGLEDYQHGISSLDATRIAQFAVGLRPLTPNQRIAGDTSDSGAVTSYDASLVAQFQVGSITRFPAAVNEASEWAYVPASRSVLVSGGDLLGQDFAGILYGDVTANWGELVGGFAGSSGGPLAGESADGDRFLESLLARSPAAPEATVTAGPTSLARNGRNPAAPQGAVLYIASSPERLENGDYKVVLGLQNADGIVAIDLRFEFDPEVADVQSVTNVGLASNLVLTQNGWVGNHAISLYGVTPMAGTGNFLEVVFTAKSSRSAVPFTAFAEANEGQIPLTLDPGLVRVEAE